ncbi:hypothetical protein HanIR_Chr06g0297321 [Helianthus annuus]|nr:hypothetical protein HanIR_Chr06g0297321 [Helianthus annuus]
MFHPCIYISITKEKHSLPCFIPASFSLYCNNHHPTIKHHPQPTEQPPPPPTIST